MPWHSLRPPTTVSGETVDVAEVVYRLSQPPAANPGAIDPGGFFTNAVPPYRLIRRYTPYSETQADCWNYGLGNNTCPSIPWDFYLGNANWMETAPTNRTGVLAENIMSLTFTYVSAVTNFQYNYWNSTNVLNIWSHELGPNVLPYNNPDINNDPNSNGALYMTNHAPAGVYITIGAIDSHTAIRLQAIAPNGTNVPNVNIGAYTNTLNQAEKFFTTFVEIPNQ